MSHNLQLPTVLWTGRPHYNCLSLPEWEALIVSQHPKLVFSLDVELSIIPSGSRPAATLRPEPLGGVGGVGEVRAAALLLASAELLGLNRVAEPGPGEDAGHAAGEGDQAGAASHMDTIGSATDPGVAVSGQLETLTLAVQCLSSYCDFLPDTLVPNSLQGFM